MLSRSVIDAVEGVINSLTPAERRRCKVSIDLVKKIFDKERPPSELPKITPIGSYKLKRFQLRLVWHDGRETVTDDYAVAAAYVGYKTQTLVVYLNKGISVFTDPHDPSNKIIITKVPRAKDSEHINTRDWVYLQHNEYSYEGYCSIADAAEYLGTTVMTIRRHLTQGNGHWTIESAHGPYTIRRVDTATSSTITARLFTPPAATGY